MKRALIFSFMAVLAVGLVGPFIPNAIAVPDPSDTVRAIIQDMKAKKDMGVVLDHVHWPSAFKGNPAAAQLGATTPEELKNKMKAAMTDPMSVLEEHLDAQMGSMPPAQKDQFLKMMAKTVEGSKQKMVDDLVATEFTVGKSIVEGENAKVEVTTLKKGKEEKDTVELILVDGKWFLTNMDGMVKPAAPKGMPGGKPEMVAP